MRIAAGIMLIIAGTASFPIALSFSVLAFPYGLLLVAYAGFIITGGICALTRRCWGLCLAASIISVAVLPIIFICVRKGEWV